MKKPANCAHVMRFPLFFTVIFSLAGLSGILFFAFTRSPSFSDWFNENVSRFGRRFLAYLTSPIPFSVAEMLLLLLPLILGVLIYFAVTKYSKSRRLALRFGCSLLSVLSLVAILFVFCFAPGYYGTTLDQKLGLSRQKVTAEQLSETALLLSEQINSLTEGQLVSATGATVMPYSLDELNGKLLDAYDSFVSQTGYPDSFWSRYKPVMLSEAMSYTHITGVYSFFTGEANLNVNFPDYTLPFTAAHELAHQRGVAREEEANFIAFLVCLSSDDAYIRYSGLLNVWEYVMSALASADRELYRNAYYALNESARAEESAYAAFFEPYRNSTASKVSEATNNAYLKSLGESEGTKSYNLVVDLAVAYYTTKNSD